MQPSELVIFDVPVYPVVLKFLSYHYDTRPFMLSSKGNRNTNAFASYLYNSLDRYNHFDTRTPKKYKHLNCCLSIAVTKWVKDYGNGIVLTPSKIGAFNDFVRQRFMETMAQEVFLKTSFGMGIRTATCEFLNRYDITEDELPLEVALKYYSRYRRKLFIEFCPETPKKRFVKLPHELSSENGQMEPRGRQVA